MSELPDIAALLPHGPPMRLLERVIGLSHGLDDADPGTAEAELTIHGDAAFRTGSGAVPAWVGIEYLGQAAALWFALQIGQGRPPQGMLVASRRYDSAVAEFAAGWRLRVRAWPTSRVDGPLVRFAGDIVHQGVALGTGELSVVLNREERR